MVSVYSITAVSVYIRCNLQGGCDWQIINFRLTNLLGHPNTDSSVKNINLEHSAHASITYG